MIKCKIENWIISLNQKTCRIIVMNQEEDFSKNYSLKMFRRDGMLLFPKYLYKLICTNIKYANIYDKFIHKFHDWDESE
jgi:hypothetical protein